ncbi:MAG: hypothetical protein HQ549_05330 [Candidatus Omnitrophica bacterium]|nr:hypothetical protein [Candidatus Omnitrophota bacterium]
MRKKVFYYLALIISLSIISSGCGKAEEPKGKGPSAKIAVKKETATTQAEPQATPKTPAQEKDTAADAEREPITEEMVLFSFEKDEDGWEVPEWALDKDDHVAESIEISSDVASEGNSSLKVNSNFPGRIWSAAIIEHEQYFDFSPYREIAVDVYITEDTPLGLRAKIILTVGDSWKWTEMTRSVPLIPGEWVTIRGDIGPGSYDWKRVLPDETFRQDIRKIVVRVESNKRPVYKGPVYIDNLRIGK